MINDIYYLISFNIFSLKIFERSLKVKIKIVFNMTTCNLNFDNYSIRNIYRGRIECIIITISDYLNFVQFDNI